MAGQMPVVVVSGGWGGADSPKGAVAGLLRPPHRFHFLLSFPDIVALLDELSYSYPETNEFQLNRGHPKFLQSQSTLQPHFRLSRDSPANEEQRTRVVAPFMTRALQFSVTGSYKGGLKKYSKKKRMQLPFQCIKPGIAPEPSNLQCKKDCERKLWSLGQPRGNSSQESTGVQ